jgi:hypothetical protein
VPVCLLCLQHPLSVGCEVTGKGFCCLAEGCDRPHLATLHGVLKAGGFSPLEGNADPPDEPADSVDCGTPGVARQLKGLLEGLGIDPNTLEVRIGVRQQVEPGRPCGGGTTGPGATKYFMGANISWARMFHGRCSAQTVTANIHGREYFMGANIVRCVHTF